MRIGTVLSLSALVEIGRGWVTSVSRCEQVISRRSLLNDLKRIMNFGQRLLRVSLGIAIAVAGLALGFLLTRDPRTSHKFAGIFSQGVRCTWGLQLCARFCLAASD